MHRLALILHELLIETTLDDPCGPVDVSTGDDVPDGVVDHPLLLVPRGRGTVQLCGTAGPPLQARPQQVTEQVVVAPPATHVVERHEEQVGPLDSLEQFLAVVASGDGIAQRTGQPVQHRCLHQELADLRGLLLEHLLGEVIHDVTVAAREGLHELRAVRPGVE